MCSTLVFFNDFICNEGAKLGDDENVLKTCFNFISFCDTECLIRN